VVADFILFIISFGLYPAAAAITEKQPCVGVGMWGVITAEDQPHASWPSLGLIWDRLCDLVGRASSRRGVHVRASPIPGTWVLELKPRAREPRMTSPARCSWNAAFRVRRRTRGGAFRHATESATDA